MRIVTWTIQRIAMKNEIIIYQADSHSERIEVTLENETVWLSLNQISTLFDRDKSVISKHLKNIFKEEELIKNSVVAFFAITATDGKTYHRVHNVAKTPHYFFGCFECLNTSKKVAKNLRDGFYTLRFTPKA